MEGAAWTDLIEMEARAEHFELIVDGIPLRLRRYRGNNRSRAVLLVHGASTCGAIFLAPRGGLVNHLLERGEVWILDWRASAPIVGPLLGAGSAPLGGSASAERRLFTLDRASEHDLPAALGVMRECLGSQIPLAIVGFCVGAGVLAMAMARGQLERFHVDAAVFMTLGLFYEVPWDGWIKSEDFILERVIAHHPDRRGVSPQPGDAWPADIASAYDRWPRAWLERGDSVLAEVYRRLTFMFGEPYAPRRLSSSLPPDMVQKMFGPIHLGMYLHLGQQVRRGFSAAFNTPDVIDRRRLARGASAPPSGPNDLAPGPFLDKRITLITGAENRLWHRDSIDLMHEWLRMAGGPAGGRGALAKHVLPSYAHLDLLWADESEKEVYPLIDAAVS